MSKLETLRKQSIKLDQDISRAKKAAYMSSNGPIFDLSKEMKKLEEKRETKKNCIAAIKEVSGLNELIEDKAPKSLAKVLNKYFQELEYETQNSQEAENEYNNIKGQIHFFKFHTEDFDRVKNSKAYCAYCRKRLKKIHNLYSVTSDDIIDDIQLLRKLTKRIFRKKSRYNKAEIKPYYEEVNELSSDCKELNKRVEQQKEGYVKKIEQYKPQFSAPDQKLALNTQHVLEVQKIVSHRTVGFRNQSLLKAFLVKLFINKKLEDASTKFTKVIKDEGVTIPTIEYDNQIQKVREEVDAIKQEREQKKIQKKTEMENLDKEIAELESYLMKT